jgi:hypothetical protein
LYFESVASNHDKLKPGRLIYMGSICIPFHQYQTSAKSGTSEFDWHLMSLIRARATLTENMKSSSGRSPPPLLPCPASSGEGGGGGGAARCRNTILLSPSRWYLTAPARVLAEPPGENTGASRIRSARRAALPAHPTKPTTTTPPSWDGEAAASEPEEEEEVEGGGVRDRTRTAEEGVA